MNWVTRMLFAGKTYIYIIMCSVVMLTSCQTARLGTGIIQYENGEYFAAQQTLRKAYRNIDAREQRPDKAKCSYYLGLSCEKLMQPRAAETAFLNARRYGYPDTVSIAEHLENVHRDKVSASDASRFVVHRFDKANSRRADFSPMLLDGTLYFTSSSEKNNGEDKSRITGTKFCDIWMMQRDEKGNWQRPELVEGGVNTPSDDGICCFSKDGQAMYYTASGGNGEGASIPRIFVSARSDAKWGAGQLLRFGNDTLTVYAHPAVSPDGNYLYFVSDAPGGSGGYDLFRATLVNNHEVGVVENLGPSVNSSADEKFPTVAPDGTLYFSSDRKGGLGGLDFYSARQDKWGQWHVTHLDAPMNSTDDDFGMTFVPDTREDLEGFFSSNRGQGKGYDNIYSFVLPSLKIRITGHVYDQDEEPIQGAVVRVVGRNGMNFKVLTRPDGSYETSIERSTEYVMMSGKPGYLNRKAQFTSDPAEEDADYEVDFILPSVSVPILVENIHYDYNEASLREESYPSLDELVTILNDNPYCTIELSAHTDRIGSQAFNLDLSQRRAQSVVDYLISQGIAPERLTPVGYGKSEPRVIDESLALKYGFPVGQILDEEYVNTLDEAHQSLADQINRRTEFKVLSNTFGIQ